MNRMEPVQFLSYEEAGSRPSCGPSEGKIEVGEGCRGWTGQGGLAQPRGALSLCVSTHKNGENISLQTSEPMLGNSLIQRLQKGNQLQTAHLSADGH